MSAARPETADTAEAPDPSVARAEKRLRVLEELTDIGMDMARALRDRVVAQAAQGEAVAGCDDGASASPRRDPADAFGRLSRAIRLTVALEAKTDAALRDLLAGVEARAVARRAEAASRATNEAVMRRRDRKKIVRRLVLEAAERETESAEVFEDLESALDERLKWDEAYAALETLPLRETVERLCADLQFTPDWSRWTGEDWGPPAPFGRPPWSPYRAPGRKPTEAWGEPEPPDLQ